MSRCAKCVAGIEHAFTHGKAAYDYHHCRCDVCSSENSQRQREVRRIRLQKFADGVGHEFTHGYGGYTNYGCRCDVCLEAGREKNAKYFERMGWRCGKCADGVAHEFKHGRGGYVRHGCRCDVCRLAARRAARERDRRMRANPTSLDRHRQRRRRWKERNSDAMAAWRFEWQEKNADYCRRQRQKWEQKYKAIPSPRNGSRWTPGEDKIVMRTDLSIVQCCYMIGRSYSSVAGRRTVLRRNASTP